MSQITIKDLTFAYEGTYDTIFENVSFQLDSDWKLGFTGRNGRGKTTFLQLLMGTYRYQGSISSSVHFDYFPFPVPAPSADTLEIASSINPEFALWELVRELKRLDVDEEVLYRPYTTLSNGERTKVLLAVLFLRENHFLLIDEPTNHLDYEARQLVGQYLNAKKGFILVSHDRAFLDQCVDHILSINKTNIEIQQGNFSSWYQNKCLQDSFELAENEKLKKEIKRLGKAARQKAGWSDLVEASKIGSHCSDRGRVGHLAAKMMKRAKTIETRQINAIEEKSKLLKNVETAESLKITCLPYHSERLVLAKDLTLFYGETPACGPVGFAVRRGDRIALHGKNGCGKSTVLKLLAGEAIRYTGQFQLGGGLTVSYVPQDSTGLKGGLTDYARECNVDESLFKAILRKLDFSRLQFEKNMEDFSEGQKKKVLIARSLCQQAHLYLWDEPLNYIDVFSRMQIEALLLTFQPTIVFVEHDQAFTEKIATQIIHL